MSTRDLEDVQTTTGDDEKSQVGISACASSSSSSMPNDQKYQPSHLRTEYDITRKDSAFDGILMSVDVERERHQGQFPLRRRWVTIPRKTCCVSTSMVLGGIVFLVMGVICIFDCEEPTRGVAFTVVGAVLLLPGCYSAFILFQYCRGVPGFSPNQLPQFD
mmetsp:Transcript_119971/g.208879  ORF Transcript_119971/g.208879 Transcript_119971/m.208879 type:complete len:161 (+) Transcript_119971:307-789(+)